MTDEERLKELDRLAKDVLILSRNTLLVNLRFLDAALSRFSYVPIKDGTMGSNGKYLLYNPRYILMNYRSEKEKMTRDYLHLVFHCVFQHMYGAVNLDRELWDLCCDMAVEKSISGLGIPSIAVKRLAQQQGVLKDLEKKLDFLSAEKLYNYYKVNKLPDKELKALKEIFLSDDHELWYLTEPKIRLMLYPYPSSDKDPLGGKVSYDGDGGGGEDDNPSSKKTNINVKGNSGGGDGNELGDGMSPSRKASAEDWKKISERMQLDLETFSKNQGKDAGNLIQNLKEVNREKYDYSSFLKKFAVRGEVMKTNDEEFDYIFYTYGLKLYDKLPLIEPLEYKEVKRIREFVIAIDTSGSVIGEEVQSFIQKTYNILKSTESFFSKINLHIIQCDAQIQEHIKITSQEEFDNYIKNMQIKGLGGTDFRPVFSKVNELIKAKEFTNLKGLIYFTDGYGTFPQKKPDYETAFVFVNDQNKIPEVPAWAIKLILKKTEILDMK